MDNNLDHNNTVGAVIDTETYSPVVRRNQFLTEEDALQRTENQSPLASATQRRLSLRNTLFYPIALSTPSADIPPPSSNGFTSSPLNELFVRDRAILTGLSQRDAEYLAHLPAGAGLATFRRNERARDIRRSLVERAQSLVPRRLDSTLENSTTPEGSVGTVVRHFSYHNFLPKNWVGNPKAEWKLDGVVWATKEKERILRQNPSTPVRTRGVAAKVCWDGSQPIRIYLGEDKQPMPYPEDNYRIYAAFRTAFVSCVCRRFGLEQYSLGWSDTIRRDGRMLDVGEMIQGLTEQGMAASELDDIVSRVSAEVNALELRVFQECTNLNKVFYRLDCVEEGLCTRMQKSLFVLTEGPIPKECLLFAPRSRRDGRAMNLHLAMVDPSLASCINQYNDRIS